MLFTSLGRSILGETVPSVRVLKTSAQFLPIRTSQPVNNIYIYMVNVYILNLKVLKQ